MTVVAVHVPSKRNLARWVGKLATLLPDWTVTSFDEAEPDNVQYVVVWRPPTGGIAEYSNLKAIVSIGAGIDHVLADSKLPKGIPIIRTVGEDLTQRMREYVALHVLRHHRDMPRQIHAQANSVWKSFVVPIASDRTVGVMGLGNLGAAVAVTLASIGFVVRGWSRSAKNISRVESYFGQDSLPAFLSQCEILVNLLPLTPATEGILNAKLFAMMPKGSCLINCARGEHLVEGDLLTALAAGNIKQATLDVFRREPLPSDHPFWQHPSITITPHVASLIDADSGGKLIAKSLLAFTSTGTCTDLTDPVRGY